MNFDQFNFIDIHYHANPDLYERLYNILEVGEYYKQLNGAVVLKSHIGSTAAQATIAQQAGLPVFGSIVLNKIAGGIHYRPILQALSEYQPIIPAKLIVHLPTITGRKHKSNLSRTIKYPYLGDFLTKPETIFNEDGKLKTELIDILKLTRDYPIVLSTGHTSKEETYALIETCEQWNVPALLLNQPANPLTGLKASELNEIAKSSLAWIEQTSLTYLLSYQDENDFSTVLKEIPRVIYSSDLGQTTQMNIEDWVKTSQEWFTRFEISTSRKAEICLLNPIQLLKI